MTTGGAGGFGCVASEGKKRGTVAGPHDHSHRGERERQGTGDDEEEKTAVQQEKELELEDETQNGLKNFHGRGLRGLVSLSLYSHRRLDMRGVRSKASARAELNYGQSIIHRLLCYIYY